ncbi:PREDICTED: protein transport protein Sec16A isoform X2 [Dufourea novaeangliae]|uniref:protein transport protein Sec16A isoform X2 n=1 Tax=Dufourea novaeangliae TaxID=178035 RepID=UPI0007674C8A|nr:PREDICTED: protein transport protein Sec16A isoform X2 [Dufourea novaeangliae]
MSNPYRARPTRSRVDNNLGYGGQNQTIWNPVTRVQSDVSSNDSVQHQSSGANQSKQTPDPWNNSWNWDFDKQADNQQQQSSQQDQQHYVPPYKNQRQPISNSIQDHYYQNVNGTKSDLINQNSVSDENTSGTASNRQPISNHSDSVPPYLNYVQYHQYPPPPRTNSVKPGSLNYEHTQWTNEQQSQNTPYTQQRPTMLSQQDQATHLPLASSNYNWHKPDQTNVLPPSNWQSNVPGHWQDPKMDKEAQSFDGMGNQCTPPLQQTRSNHHLPPSNENTNKEHSINNVNNWPNQMNVPASQWNSPNCESVLPSQSQQTQNFSVNNDFSSWPQMTNTDVSQQWKQADELHSNQWIQEQQENNNLPDESIEQDNAGVTPLNDWQQNRTLSSHHSLPNMPPTPESSTEQEERKKSIPSLIPNSMVSKDSNIHAKTNVSKLQLLDSHLNVSATPETIPTVASSESVSLQENNELNVTADLLEWGKNNSSEELPAKLEQMSLGSKLSQHLENQTEPSETLNPVISGDVWNQSTVAHVATSDNISGLSSDYTVPSTENSHSTDNQAIVNQEQSAHSTYQVTSVKPIDNVAQTGYDQWYNQNTLPRASENTWYSKDHSRPAKEWSVEQNVENYENIQQPTEFVNLEVVTPSLQERDLYGSRDSINKETLDNDPKPVINPVKEVVNARDFRQEVNNIEVPSAQQATRSHPTLQPEQVPDNYEFASNDRNTFLETGELTDSHQEHEPTPPSQDEENDEVPNDIPFLREVPGQSSSIDPRRNDPTGQEQYVQTAQRLPDPRRNDPSGQEQGLQLRNMPERSERRDVPPGQERTVSVLSRSDSDTLERRNDPSGRERSLPPQQSRNDPSGEERHQSQAQIMLESSEIREVPGRGNEPEDPSQQTDENLRQIPGGASPNEAAQSSDDRPNGRVVTGSQELPSAGSALPDQASDSRSKREEAVGASIREGQGVSGSLNRRDSYEDEDDEGSGNSRDGSRERRRDSSSERRRYEYERKNAYYDREREYDDDYYYDRRRGGENDRSYNARDEFDRREMPYREDDRKHHSRDDLDRHIREEVERRSRTKDDLDERDGRRRVDDRRKDRPDDVRRREREVRDYDPRYPRDRDYLDRDRRREDRRPRRYDDYDVRDPYYDDPYSRGSRPSSRSSYNDRDRAYYSRSRDPYYGYNGYPGYDYGSHYANNYYAYIENLRRTNPAAYSEWYHKYYANQQQQHISRGVTNYPEDRASVHSGRSSCDDRTTGDKRTLGDMSLLEDSTNASARMTPTKYSISHAYGCFSIGSLVHVLPSYPTDGERAKVDILRLDNLLLHDPVTRDLRAYPGPLIKQVGVTHKKTIIEYCENKIKKAASNDEMTDHASYILLYELMIMLIQQNGNVVGVDIAALLLRNTEAYPYDTNKQKSQDLGRRESVISQRSGLGGDGLQSTQDGAVVSENVESKPRKSIEEITDEFRNTLLYGLVQEALEYAMNEGLWGHALFLASKLDKRTHASVMTRFANSLPYHDPLQTLYQLHSGRVPAVVTSISDPRWDDWRPHLAMIISNTSANPEINRRSITTLGDTLSTRGDIHAAHFCYILAQIDFGAYGANNVKLVLIGANHHKPYNTFLTTEAIMLTEIYEYARNLSEPGFTLVDLQTFKFDLATKMADHGLIEKALLYIEQIAVNIVNEPSKYKKSFISAVYNLGDRIKYHDPVYKDSTEETITLTWFNNLAEIVGKCYSGEIVESDSHGSQMKESYNSVQNQEMYEMKQQQQQSQHWNPTQPDYREGPTSMMEVPSTDVQSEWQPLSLPSNIPDTYDQTVQYTRNNEESYQQLQQQEYWNQDSYYHNNYGRNDSTLTNWQQQTTHVPYSSEQGDIDNSQQQEKWNSEPQQPAISMTPSTRKQYDPLEELDALETPKQSSRSAASNKKTSEKPTEKKSSNSGGSWFGGLFSKLAPKPKNQMILPDDNNPTIVWDPVAKKWMNKDEDGDTSSATLAPPPKASDMGFRAPVMEQSSQPPQPPSQTDESGVNKFKLPKVRSMRANYIDVMNPGGSKNSTGSSSIPTPVTSPMVPMATSSPQLFIPAPVDGPNAPVAFLTPTSASVAPSANVSENPSQGLSRWSSTSSLSREVQSYTMRDPRLLPRNKAPMMYNPSDMKDHSAKNMQPSRYPPR